jgi:hypothetical protein
VDGSTSDRIKHEWVIEAEAGQKVQITVRHPRAGVVRRELELK